MPGAAKKSTRKRFAKSFYMENSTERSQARRPKSKPTYHEKAIGSNEKVINFVSKRKRNLITKARSRKRNTLKKKSSFRSLGDKASSVISDESKKSRKLKKRGKRKRQQYTVEVDEPSRLQRRTRNLLIRIKLEQNLIDAYSTEGWKGQSREKIKPEKELQRAKKQILKCKLGIRDAIRHLDSLSSIGCIDDFAVAPDGSVHHEHIICAKCKLREAFPDNDIILCDGTCNCAFHQKCLDPPLLTENIPQGDQGWFCKFCECKIAIIEAMNAHIGTHFSADSNWQDIFKEEAAIPDGGDALLNPEVELPSDDSEDDDFDPNNIESSGKDGSEDKGNESDSSSDSLWSLKGEMFPERGPDSDDATSDCDVLIGQRERRAVDYRKLYDEMFGKDAHANEQMSEDEDWGPTKRKRREKESDAASTLMALGDSEKKKLKDENTQKLKNKLPSRNFKRTFFRIPPNALEKLRSVFAENELPSRSVRENLSKQLGIDSGKVNKWFKNTRYHALKSRKNERRKSFLGVNRISRSDIGKDKMADEMPSNDSPSKSLNTFHGQNKLELLSSHLKKRRHKRTLPRSPTNNEVATPFGDDVSLQLLLEKAKKEKKKVNFNKKEAEAEKEMERLCKLKDQVKKLQKVLLGLPNSKTGKSGLPSLNELSVVYVPVAELREKK